MAATGLCAIVYVPGPGFPTSQRNLVGLGGRIRIPEVDCIGRGSYYPGGGNANFESGSRGRPAMLVFPLFANIDGILYSKPGDSLLGSFKVVLYPKLKLGDAERSRVSARSYIK